MSRSGSKPGPIRGMAISSSSDWIEACSDEDELESVFDVKELSLAYVFRFCIVSYSRATSCDSLFMIFNLRLENCQINQIIFKLYFKSIRF